ncbi:MAG: putative thiolase [Dehalococcoidia bacterium]|nr:putative thiolase [Dehalococcoidia bacterium]
MWEHRGKVAYAGVGHAEVSRRWDEDPQTSIGALAIRAATRAIEDCGLRLEDIDGVFSSPGPLGDAWAPREVPISMVERFQMTPGDTEDGIAKVTAAWLARNMGLKELKVCEDRYLIIGTLLNHAIDAVVAGRCSYALVVRPLNNFAGRYGQVGEAAAGEVRGPAQFEHPYGFTGPARFASLFQRYLWKYNRRHEELADFVLNNRRNGLMCEYGYYYQNRPEPLTREEYLSARWVTEPINLYDCDMPVHTAAAFILTTAERARNLKHPPAFVLGHARTRHRARSVTHSLEDVEETNAAFASRLYADAGVGPEDMQFANLYDGFTVVTPMWVEAFGLSGKGEGLPWMTAERIAIEGSFPLNTSGGSNGVGRTHGVSQHLDAVLQLQGRAGKRQVKNRDLCIAESGPPPDAPGAQILCSAPGP